MSELCLMTSSTHLPGLFQEQGLNRPSKELQNVIPSSGRRQEMLRSSLLHPRPPLVGDPWKPMGMFFDNKYAKLDKTSGKPLLIDIQDARPDSTIFSFGIAEHCTRHQKILEYLKSGSNEAEIDGLNISLLSNLMGIQTSTIDIPLQSLNPHDDDFCLYEVGEDKPRPSLIFPRDFYAQKHLLDLVGDLANSSQIVVDPHGQVLFTGTGIEMKDLPSIIEEFYLSKNTMNRKKQPLLIPHFTRLDTRESQANIHGSSLKVEAVTFAPLKSPEKMKKKSSKKRSSRKTEREGGVYRGNGFYACETLLSLMVNKKRGKDTILSVKKHGPEIPQLLNQFSAGIAGTGLAVLFSVGSKVVSGRVPFCASKVLNTGVGLGLVWLAWAFTRLRDTVVHINKNPSKSGMNEKEIFRRVDKSVNEILFRAATVMAVALLRLA